MRLPSKQTLGLSAPPGLFQSRSGVSPPRLAYALEISRNGQTHLFLVARRLLTREIATMRLLFPATNVEILSLRHTLTEKRRGCPDGTNVVLEGVQAKSCLEAWKAGKNDRSHHTPHFVCFLNWRSQVKSEIVLLHYLGDASNLSMARVPPSSTARVDLHRDQHR